MDEYSILDKIKYRIISETRKGPCIIYVTGTFMEVDLRGMYEEVKRGSDVDDFILCEVQISDWDTFLTPWKAEGGMKGRSFDGKAVETLDEIRGKLIPVIRSQFAGYTEFYIAGYSLAGLFSLWCLYESDLFAGAACCSGSLWYPGWDEYVANHAFGRKETIYLSLGDKEEKTKHPLMKLVGDRMRKQYEILKDDEMIEACVLEWNDGGHFNNTVERTVRGMRYLVGR